VQSTLFYKDLYGECTVAMFVHDNGRNIALITCQIATVIRIFSISIALHKVAKAALHYGDYRSMIVPFEAQKIIFYVLTDPSLEQFAPWCKRHLKG
jgi:hypothetical protein